MCVQDADDRCVLQFTLRSAAGCALHRRASRVIHRSELCIACSGTSSVWCIDPGRRQAEPPAHGPSPGPCFCWLVRASSAAAPPASALPCPRVTAQAGVSSPGGLASQGHRRSLRRTTTVQRGAHTPLSRCISHRAAGRRLFERNRAKSPVDAGGSQGEALLERSAELPSASSLVGTRTVRLAETRGYGPLASDRRPPGAESHAVRRTLKAVAGAADRRWV